MSSPAPSKLCGRCPSKTVLLGGAESQSTRLLPRRASIMPLSALGRSRRCRSSGRCRLWWNRRLGRCGSAPGLPVEDYQPDRNCTPYAHDDAAELVLDAPFDVVRDDEQQNAASGVVEQPRVPERHRHRHYEAGHEDGWLQGTLFQKEGGQVPAGHQRRQDRGGNKRRVAKPLQPWEGDPVPSRMLAQRPVRRVDHAHREHHEECSKGGEAQRRYARSGRYVEPYDGQVYRERHSYGRRVPVPPHAPTDYPQAELLESSPALGYGDHDEGGQERAGWQEPHALDRQESPRDRVAQDEECDYWVSSHDA